MGGGGEGGLELGLVAVRAMLDGRGVGGVGSTGPSGVKAGDYRHCVGAGGYRLGEDCSTLSGHEVEAVERSVVGRIVEAGGVIYW